MEQAHLPLVSVVLPVYNGETTVAATVQSVLRQDFEDLELIIIDDGCTDRTREVVAGIQDSRLSIHSFENRGLAASRNRGIRLAKGDFVAFVDADDLWTPSKLRRQFEALAANPEAGMAYSLTDCIDEHENYIGPGSHVEQSGRVYEQLLTRNFIESGSNPLIPRGVFENLGFFDESLIAAEDWDFFLRVALAYPVVCVPEAQILYRIHGHAMSSNIVRQKSACFRVFAAALERLPDGPDRDRIDRAGRANLYRYFARRVITTAPGPRAVLPAFRYIWQWVSLAPDRLGSLRKAVIQLGKAIILVILPHSMARPLLSGIDRRFHRVRPSSAR